MRIAMLCADPGVPYPGTKGASLHMGAVAAALRAIGVEVNVIVASPTAGAEPGVERLPGPAKGASSADHLAAEPLRTAWLSRRLDELRADALYERLSLYTSAGSEGARAAGVPHLVEVNSPLPAEARSFRSLEDPEWAEELEAATLANASVVFAVSRPIADYARERGAQRVELLPNAVDVERFPPRAGFPSEPTAVFAGTLRPWHGVEAIVDAWSRLGAEAPRLLVIGDGPEKSRLERAGAEVTGIVDRDDVPALLGDATIGLAPYRAGGPDYFSPIKLFEYLAAGLPIVAGAIPGVADIVDARQAVLIPPGDSAALATAVKSLAADPSRCATLGAAGRELVEKRHTWRRRASRIADVARESSGKAVAR